MGLISQTSKNIKRDNKQFISKNLDISQQVYEILESKGWNQKKLANALGKSESEISKLLSGLHNLTLKSITQLEVVLETDIIITPNKISSKLSDLDRGLTFFNFNNTTLVDDIPDSNTDPKIIALNPIIPTLRYGGQ